MKLVDMHAVEGDPERGGTNIRQLGDILQLNQLAYKNGEARNVIILSVQPTVEAALDAERELRASRKK